MKSRTLRGTLWTIDAVNELERELIANIEKLDGNPRDIKRLANQVSNQLGKIRALVNAERYLEDNCGVVFIRGDE